MRRPAGSRWRATFVLNSLVVVPFLVLGRYLPASGSHQRGRLGVPHESNFEPLAIETENPKDREREAASVGGLFIRFPASE
jgi:hypothetical protein